MASASSTSPRVAAKGSFERSDDDYFPLTQSYLFFGFVIKVLRVPGVIASVDDFFYALETSVREVILVTTKHLPTFCGIGRFASGRRIRQKEGPRQTLPYRQGGPANSKDEGLCYS